MILLPAVLLRTALLGIKLLLGVLLRTTLLGIIPILGILLRTALLETFLLRWTLIGNCPTVGNHTANSCGGYKPTIGSPNAHDSTGGYPSARNPTAAATNGHYRNIWIPIALEHTTKDVSVESSAVCRITYWEMIYCQESYQGWWSYCHWHYDCQSYCDFSYCS